MDANEYQKAAHETAAYGCNEHYPFLGLAEEAGEVLGKVKKFIRHNKGESPSPAHYKVEKNFICIATRDPQHYSTVMTDISKRFIENYDEFLPKLAKELGDVMWYVAEIATCYDLKLSDIMSQNLAKLADRKNRNVIDGEGDER